MNFNFICPHCKQNINYEIKDIKKFVICDTLNEYYYINCPSCKKAIKMLKRNIKKESNN